MRLCEIPGKDVPHSDKIKLMRPARGFVAIVIALVITIALGAGAMFAYQKFSLKPTTSPSPQYDRSVNLDKASPAASSSDETANWKTYKDEKLKFSIKYPKEIAIYRELPEGGVEFVRTENTKKDSREVTMLAVYTRGSGGTDPEKVFRDSECPNPCNEKVEAVKLNNAVGIKTLGPGYPYEYNYYLTNLSKSATVVRLFLYPNDVDPNKDLTPFRQILSTFRFE